MDAFDDAVPGRVTVLSDEGGLRSRTATARGPYLEEVVVRVLLVPRLVSGGDGGRALRVSPGERSPSSFSTRESVDGVGGYSESGRARGTGDGRCLRLRSGVSRFCDVLNVGMDGSSGVAGVVVMSTFVTSPSVWIGAGGGGDGGGGVLSGVGTCSNAGSSTTGTATPRVVSSSSSLSVSAAPDIAVDARVVAGGVGGVSPGGPGITMSTSEEIERSA